MKPRPTIVVWPLALLLAACGTLPATPAALPPTATPPVASAPDAARQMIVTDDFAGVVFSREWVEHSDFEAMFGEGVEGYWTPSEEDILELEQRIESYLQQEANSRYPDIWRELPKYRRQYVGTVEDGQRKVFAIFFCEPSGSDWERDLVFVLDGGECFFEVKYDVETGTFSDLNLHGEA